MSTFLPRPVQKREIPPIKSARLVCRSWIWAATSVYRTMGHCHQLRIHGNIHKKAPVGPLCPGLPPIYVNHIGNRLKSVKRNTNRQGKSRNRQRKAGQAVYALHQHAAVFKNTQQPQIHNQRRNQRRFCLPAPRISFTNAPMKIINGSTEDQKRNPYRFPPCVKKQRKYNQNAVSPSGIFGDIVK